MTDKELNHAIATKLGWKPIPPIPGREHLFEGYMLKPDAKSEHDIEKVPDFTGSLDAMHQAEEWITTQGDSAMRTYWNAAVARELTRLDSDSRELAGFSLFGCSAKTKAISFAEAFILPVAGKEVEG